jgi:hypothetical protein
LVTITHQDDEATVTLEIPAPIIPPGVSIAIEDHPLQDAPRDVRDAGVRQAFHVLTPQELLFAQPIRVSVTMPRSALTRPDGSLALTVPAIRTADGHWDWLSDPIVTVTADTVEMTGLTTHLGSLFVWSDLTDLVGVGSSLSPQPIGQQFRLVVGFRPRDERPNPVNLTDAESWVVDNTSVLALDLATGGVIVSYPKADTDATCQATGDYAVTLTARLGNFGADAPFLSDTLGLPPTDLTLNYLVAGNCVRPAPSAPPPSAAPTPASSASPTPSASPSQSPSASGSPSPSASHGPSFSPPPKSSPTSSP